jgi:small-conductance mechanosensitive channel
MVFFYRLFVFLIMFLVVVHAFTRPQHLHQLSKGCRHKGFSTLHCKAVFVDGAELSVVRPPTFQRKASFTASTINLLKNSVGPGTLFLHARASSLSNLKGIPVLTSIMAIWAVYNFYIIGDTCALTKSESYGDAWTRAVPAWKSTNHLVHAVTVLAPMIGCLSNIIVLRETLRLFLQLMHVPATVHQSRNRVTSILIGVILFPLCRLKSLSALKSISFLGLLGQLFVLMVLFMRSMDGSYKLGGRYFSTANFATTFVASTSSFTNWILFASLLSYCLVSHYNVSRRNVQMLIMTLLMVVP